MVSLGEKTVMNFEITAATKPPRIPASPRPIQILWCSEHFVSSQL